MRTTHLASHLTTGEFAASPTSEPHERSWWLILWPLSQERTAGGVAEDTDYSRYWIGQIVRRYNDQRPAGMVNRQHTTAHRAPTLLNSAQRLTVL